MKLIPNDIRFKNKLQLLSNEFNNNYNAWLVQVYKTINHKIFMDKFIKCQGDISQYYAIWNECIKLYLNERLKNYKIKESIGLIFAIMDHLFSYKLYEQLCNISYDKQTHESSPKPKSVEIQNRIEKDIHLPIKGNLIFSEIENKYIPWLFDYWKSILLQSAEAVKCLCRSYLINTDINNSKSTHNEPGMNNIYYCFN